GQRLSALIDGELSMAERDRVLAHLARCEPCRQEAIALRALKRRMTALSETTAGTDLVARLLAMTPPAGRPSTGPLRRPAWRRRAAVAAAISSVAVAGVTAAAFLAGGGGQPGPTVTPPIDVFLTQHAITPATAPSATPAPEPTTRPGQTEAP
ncbi:MAG: zf-HC2 domain-containing protein, partial [Actinobacteria bacterium]|nr:zf-HC2 domain-containing protein [Actinomycetota bacterium]